MKKTFLAVLGAGLILTACTKKEEVKEEVTTETTTVETVEQDGQVLSETVTETTTTGESINYVSADGNTKFNVVFNAEEGTAVVTNETTGKVYQMKNVVSGSGSKYEDADKNFFWTHQGEFEFGKGETTEIQGKEVK